MKIFDLLKAFREKALGNGFVNTGPLYWSSDSEGNSLPVAEQVFDQAEFEKDLDSIEEEIQELLEAKRKSSFLRLKNEIVTDKQKAIDLLREAGIIDENGNLSATFGD